MGDRLATMGRSVRGAAVPLSVGGAGSPSNTMLPGPIEAYLRTKWYPDPSSRLATIYMGRKVGELLCPFPGGLGSPSNTLSPGPRPTCMPSFILIHPTVWPQYTNVTDRTDRQRSDSIRRFTNGRPKIGAHHCPSPRPSLLLILNCRRAALLIEWSCFHSLKHAF